ncbi:MAG TPA: aminotransferase class III-fold pyridoxal phosphate-dependent enzyme [Gemmatimonadaceae bacterium]|nr:aminotransferase class III-fold pyridoxal phosphate-dependent enzyme [Gemmatimonadaceae bacterium]
MAILDFDRSDENVWRPRAAAIIPGGASTGSKRPEALFGERVGELPTHFMRASGCRIETADGRQLIDCTMALGAVTLGYADDVVTRAVLEAASNGNVCGLSPAMEVDVAERLAELIPCAEQVRFLKTGAEAVAAAVRIARAHTGRSVVIACGYFGWLDWSSDASGVPESVRADIVRVPYDDVDALETTAKHLGDRLAAIVLEPVIERLPSVEWIAEARRACDESGAVLIFDEIKTGFRLKPGGYQELVDVAPDLAVFGKALANGYPLSAVVGRESVMRAASDTWISSTLASETVSLAAARAVIEWHARAEVCESLGEIGAEMRSAVDRAIVASRVEGVRVDGLDHMWLIRFDSPARESRFLELAVDAGVLFKRGAYDFPSLAHDEEAIAEIESAASSALVRLRDEE